MTPRLSHGVCRPRRRGIALVAVMVLLALVGLVGGALLRSGMLARQRQVAFEREAQADWLLRAGYTRARARLAADPMFRQETWSIPADQLGGRDLATVALRLEPAAENDPFVRVTIHVELSQDPGRRVRRHATYRLIPPAADQGETPP
jgi:type II secretory pathway pseudopilin PulG